MIGEVTHLGGLSGLSGRITLLAGEAIFQVNVSCYTCENATRGCKMCVNASYFSATARWATWPTWVPDPHISFSFLCRLSLSLVRENPNLLLETFITLLPRYFWSAEYFTFGSKAPLVSSRLKWASKWVFIFRLVVSCIITCAGIGYPFFKWFSKTRLQTGSSEAFWSLDDGGYALHLFSTIGEWVACLCLALFPASFYEEFKTFSPEIHHVKVKELTDSKKSNYVKIGTN